MQTVQNDKTIIFTEIIGCAEVGKIALESFHKHHDLIVHIFATPKDIAMLGPIGKHKNNRFVYDTSEGEELLQLYATGHRGTAYIFAKAFSGALFPEYDNVIHFDSDVFFKKECVSLIETLFANGADIVGSRRCYVNNPGGVPVQPGIPDAVSTYFFGMKRKVMPTLYSFEELVKMYEGHNIGLPFDVFDFGDCITFHALKNGAEIRYISSNIFGGQNESGSKVNNYKSNLHLDAGSALVHFGGAGSGCTYYQNSENKNESYGKWAVIRYALFCRIFYNKTHVIYAAPGPVIDQNGRWVSGDFNDEILNTIKQDILN